MLSMSGGGRRNAAASMPAVMSCSHLQEESKQEHSQQQYN
jgi:hypothetical protein